MRASWKLVVASSLLSVASASADEPPAPAPAPAPEANREDMPVSVRMRTLEQKTQALKERAWQLKARVQLLKEQMIGGGVGAQAVITHDSEMGSSFRITKLSYSVDGAEVFVRADDSGDKLYKTNAFDVFTGPIVPGSHTLVASATYRGHGFGVFSYLSDYVITVSTPQVFVVEEGKTTRVACRGYEKGGATVPMEKRAAIECKISQSNPDSVPAPVQTTPGSTPMPTVAPTPAPAGDAGK